MVLDLSHHPCFNKEVRKQYGRIHLPVAPACNVQCNFCDRQYDCVNETRPGVTSVVLSPAQALHYLKTSMQIVPDIRVVGIAGPGDPFANAQKTLETLTAVRESFPNMLLCVASNGLEVSPYLDELAELDVSHVTITINALDSKIGALVYRWFRLNKKVYRGTEGAQLLLDRQLKAIRGLVERDIVVKANTIVIPGVNDHCIQEIAESLKDMGVQIMNCVPLYPVTETPFGNLKQPSAMTMREIRAHAGEHLPQMTHCARCRADAIGRLGEDTSPVQIERLREAAAAPLNPGEDRPFVAVSSREGMLINQHLGEAQRILIFGKKGAEYNLIETRKAPNRGHGPQRWEDLSNILKDCRAILVSNAGEAPQKILNQNGIRVAVTGGLIEDGLEAIYSGGSIRLPVKSPRPCDCSRSSGGPGCM